MQRVGEAAVPSRLRAVGLLLALVALGMAAYQGTALGARGDTLVVAQGADTTTLDPQKQGKIIDMSVLINMFDMLLMRDRQGNLVPWLATEWKPIDPYTWRFKLRQGVRFHDGEPFNADVVKFSIERLINPATKSPIVELRYVKEVRVVDPYTVDIVTQEPDPLIPAKLTLFGGVMVPPRYIKEHGDDYFATHPVGTGPFKFVEWVRDDRVVMEANPDYWAGPPKVKRLIFKAIPNDADRVAALLAGEVDVIANLPPDAFDVVRRTPGVKALSVPGLRAHFLSLDSRWGPLKDVRVRQAIAYAIDADGILRNVVGGHGERLNTLIPPAMFGYDPSVKPYPYDPQRARQLLLEAGYPNGFDVKIHATSGIYMKDRDVAQAVAGQLSQVGIRAQVEILEYGTFLDYLRTDRLAAIYFIGNLAWTMDGANNLQSYVRSDRRYSRMKDARADELVLVEETSMDLAKRQAAFSEIQRILRDGAYFVGLFVGNDLYGVSERVNWTPPRNQVLWMYEASLK